MTGPGAGMRDLSVVIPVYNGAETVGAVVEQLVAELDDVLHEVVLVDDGSRDASVEVCVRLVERHRPRVRLLELTHNFSEHNAVMAGLNAVSGRYVAVVDDDGQHTAHGVRQLLDECRRGRDAVYSAYEKRRDPLWRRAGSALHNIMADSILGKPSWLYLSSFKVMDSRVVREVVASRNPHPYIDALVLQCARRITSVPVDHRPRLAGRSGYTLAKLLKVWASMVLASPARVLQVPAWLGGALLVAGGALLLVASADPRAAAVRSPTWVAALLLAAGLASLLLGLLGLRVARRLLVESGKPQFVVRRRVGWE